MFHVELGTLYAFSLATFRVLGTLITAPFFSSRNTLSTTRIALALAVTLPAFFGAASPSAPLPSHFFALAFDVASESMLGLVAGLCSSMVLNAAFAAGHLASHSMGLSYGTLFDPINGAESTALAEIFTTLTLACAVALGAHRDVIRWLAVSFQEIPLGGHGALLLWLEHCIQSAILSATLSVRLAFPMMAAVTFGYTAFAFMSRAAPQIQLNNVGFSISIIAGGGAAYLVAPSVAHTLAEATARAFRVG